MENPLFKKLQIKAGFKLTVVNAPANLSTIVGPLPIDVKILLSKQSDFDAVFIFAVTKADLLAALERIMLTAKTICWIFYPKAKSKLASDLNLMQSWEDLKRFELSPCGSAAVNETWTALRIKLETEMKRSGLGNSEITANAYGDYIDVVNKVITLPKDVEVELRKNIGAYNFYQQLSYSNRKEYVLWILSAKQEKTKLERIAKMIDKLASAKKNPNEK